MQVLRFTFTICIGQGEVDQITGTLKFFFWGGGIFVEELDLSVLFFVSFDVFHFL